MKKRNYYKKRTEFLRLIENAMKKYIISAIIVLGKKLGLDLIAEGVETDRQLQFLTTQMCDEIQGYLFHRPMPAKEIEKLLNSSSK